MVFVYELNNNLNKNNLNDVIFAVHNTNNEYAAYIIHDKISNDNFNPVYVWKLPNFGMFTMEPSGSYLLHSIKYGIISVGNTRGRNNFMTLSLDHNIDSIDDHKWKNENMRWR